MGEVAAAELAARYDATAQAYRTWWAPVLVRAAGAILPELPLEAAARIIDIGTGVGSLYSMLREAAPGAQIIGLDRSAGMLSLAPPRMQRAIGDARWLPLASHSADIALMFFVLFHVERPIEALREARRVLRPGGWVAAITWATDMDSAANRLWTQCLHKHGAAPQASTNHDALDSPQKLESLMQQAGFAHVRAFERELAFDFTADHFVSLKSGVGIDSRCLQTLCLPSRKACIADVSRQIGALGPAGLRATARLVYALAR